ncbi:MAG: hypothetical protein AAB600_05380, partial [Patescibacteria group bacterium]
TKGYNAQYESLKSAYYNSQYAKKENPGIMPDETFESFAGGAFARGVNPILIVHEHPPLGRYIIGLSTILFDNAKTLILPCLLISVFGIYLIGRIILKKTLFVLIPLGIFVNEPLFVSKLTIAPLLEPIQLPFIIFSLYFFIRGIESKKSLPWFMATSLMVGAVASIRFFILGAALFVSMLIYMILRKKLDKKVVQFVVSLPFSLIPLFASYTKTMMDGYSFLQILGVQKYIFAYHHSKIIVFFSFWDLILFNRWHTWWGDRRILHEVHWIIAWPISAFLTYASLILVFLKKIKASKARKALFIWIIVYSLLLSMGTATTRYFLPLLPFLYILGVDFLIKMYQIKFSKLKR